MGAEDFVGRSILPRDEPPSSVDPERYAGVSLGMSAPQPEEWSEPRKALTAAGAGAGAVGAGLVLRKMLHSAFPGMTPTRSALVHIDKAIKHADESANLQKMFGEYMRHASDTDRPLSFADFMAQQPGHHATVATIQELIKHSGNVPAIEGKLADRVGGARQRILADIASAMGVPQQSISEGLEKLKAAKSARAQPLYDKAFEDSDPIRDTKLLQLFGEDTPNMAMMNALKSRIKTLALQGREPPSLKAADPARKDAWRRLLTTEVPEQMFSGDEWRGLREYYAPAVEDLHHMRRNLWDHYQQAKRGSDTEAAKAYRDAWVKLTGYLDNQTGGAYKAARDAYKGDSDLENAFQTGSELLSMKPDEVRLATKAMGANERQALSAGFYGGMQDMGQQRLLREFVRRPELYPDRRELLSTVFRDPVQLDQFLKHLEGEEAMQNSAGAFTNLPPSHDPLPRLPYARGFVPIGGNPMDAKARLYEYLDPSKYLGWPSRRASRAGTDFAFSEPRSGQTTTHPYWGDVDALRPRSGLERALGLGKNLGYGGAGGLGLYGLSKLPSDPNVSDFDFDTP